MPRRRRRTAISGAAVAERARWAGMLGEPELTPEEQRVLREHQKGSWAPQHGLRLLWNCYDADHGDPWVLREFETATDADRREIDAFVRDYPDQLDRLARWMRAVEALAVRREEGTGDQQMGAVYASLSALGYRGGR